MQLPTRISYEVCLVFQHKDIKNGGSYREIVDIPKLQYFEICGGRLAVRGAVPSKVSTAHPKIPSVTTE